jgi:predicted DNA-binding protein with PD1-like motif
MRSKLIREQAGERTWAVVFETGEEAVAGLREFAAAANLIGSHLSAIGAFSGVVLGFFDPDARRYVPVAVREQVEVLSLLGNVAQHDGRLKVHAHVVVGRRDGTALGGHLLEGHVRPTLEVIVVESPEHLERQTDEVTGLALLKID